MTAVRESQRSMRSRVIRDHGREINISSLHRYLLHQPRSNSSASSVLPRPWRFLPVPGYAVDAKGSI